jgi:hypothetical protein
VYLDEVGDPEIGPNLRQAEERDQLLALHSQVSALQRSVEGLRASMEENRVEGRREFQMMQSNIRRIAIQPVVRRAAAVANGPNGGAGAGAGAGAVPCVTTLTANPRTPIYCGRSMSMVLQDARQHDFTRERGRVKHKYCRRSWFGIASPR